MWTPNAGKWLIAALIASPVTAAEPDVDYATQIKPLFEQHCVACHGALRKQGGLRLDASQFLVEGGDSGFTIVAGEPESSTLVAALKGEDGVPRMPKDGPPLSDDEIALVERWIAAGAQAPDEEPVAGDPEAHWSFRPVRRPRVPDVAGDVRNPIDAFVIAKRAALTSARSASKGHTSLQPVGEAPKHVLLRRVYLDLIGLPPTTKELQVYLADDSPDAYESVVDRLLNDPRHGERWGRHWMDVWRYSDWYGYKAELRNSQRHIWRWRDWIVESLNAGMPYDRMITLMLAADEVAPTDAQSLRATGFLARNYYKFNRDVWLDRTVEHTGKAFLGLTFNCAKCHDHMFDPISQRDYYAMRAFFEPHRVRVDPIDGVLDEKKDGLPRIYDDAANTPTYLYVRGNDKMPDKENPLTPTLPGFFVADSPAPQPVSLPPRAFYPGMRPGVRESLLAQATADVTNTQKSMETLLAQVSVEAPKPDDAEDASPTPLQIAEANHAAAKSRLAALQARIDADDAKYARPPAANADELAIAAANAERSATLATAQAKRLAAEAELAAAQSQPEAKRKKAVAAANKTLDAARKAVETATTAAKKTDASYSPLTKVYPAESTGRRTLLANWITDPANPLTARVAVNHVWMRHFGKPLVESVFDFGSNGTQPTHPALLDWLAAEFVASGWDMKHLHRLMVTSATYRLDSRIAEPAAPNPKSAFRNPQSIDPDNTLLWHMNARRAEGEVIRDSLLALSGQLDRTLGGPELAETTDQTTFRRSLYYRHAPEKNALFLKTFDGPNPDECYRRAVTVVPQQALAEMNSRLSREQSRRVAASLAAKGEDSGDAAIDAAFLMILCRPATSEERAACTIFLAEQQARLAVPADLSPIDAGPEIGVPAPETSRERAFASLIHVLVNHHDFVMIR